MSNPSAAGVPCGISLSNTVHSEVAPCLPLPSLPVFCGSLDQELRLFDDGRSRWSSNQGDVTGKIADLLRNTDVSYLNLKDQASSQPGDFIANSDLLNEVLRHDPDAFECVASGFGKKPTYGSKFTESKPFEQRMPVHNHLLRDSSEVRRDADQDQRDSVGTKKTQQDQYVNKKSISSSRKPKVKQKGKDGFPSAVCLDSRDFQDSAIAGCCDMLEEICSRGEVFGDDREEAEFVPLSFADLKVLTNEIMSMRAKKVLHMVRTDVLSRTLKCLDHQIHRAEGLSINYGEHLDADVVSSIYCSLESIHAAVAIMAHDGMPKQLYKEENIERILDFTRHQILDVMFACDPAYRALHKPTDMECMMIYYSYTYTQHRSHVMDETVQIILKSPLSKRVPQTYHLPDEEQRQIQLITTLVIQMVQYSPNLPEVIRSENPSLEVLVDTGYPAKCHEAITESFCLFWTRVLQRLSSTKSQDASELKMIMENLVMDLLATLNLPEYPALAAILEVLCVLLLQNAVLKSKDIAARIMAIDLLGTIAARLKHDTVLCRNETLWILQELISSENLDQCKKDACSICKGAISERSLFICQGCQRSFHGSFGWNGE